MDGFRMLGSMLGWSFLPGIISGLLQSFWYRLITPAGAPMPRAGTINFARDRVRISAIVVFGYLLYTIYEAEVSLRPNYYQILGVSPTVDLARARSTFRRIAIQYHPDKNPGPEGEAYFVQAREAFDVLNDPVKRMAYDKFGPTIGQWKGMVIARDYILQGAQSSIGFYIGTGGIMAVLTILHRAQFGQYWRFVAFLLLGVLEASMVLHPSTPVSPANLMALFVPWRTTFEHISILHSLFITISIAITQASVLFPSPQTPYYDSPAALVYALQPHLDALGKITTLTEAETYARLNEANAPFVIPRPPETRHKREENGEDNAGPEKIPPSPPTLYDKKAMVELRRRMERTMLNMRLVRDTVLGDKIAAAVQRRRGGRGPN